MSSDLRIILLSASNFRLTDTHRQTGHLMYLIACLPKSDRFSLSLPLIFRRYSPREQALSHEFSMMRASFSLSTGPNVLPGDLERLCGPQKWFILVSKTREERTVKLKNSCRPCDLAVNHPRDKLRGTLILPTGPLESVHSHFLTHVIAWSAHQHGPDDPRGDLQI